MKTALLPLVLAAIIRGHVHHLTARSLNSATGLQIPRT